MWASHLFLVPAEEGVNFQQAVSHLCRQAEGGIGYGLLELLHLKFLVENQFIYLWLNILNVKMAAKCV